MKTTSLDIAIAVGMLLLSSYLLYQSWGYGVWGDGATGSGFFPALAGVVIFFCSLGILLDNGSRADFKEDAIAFQQLKPIVGIIIATAAYIFFADRLGMVPLTLLYIPAVAYSIQQPSTHRGHFMIWIISGIATFLFYLLFDVALDVPLPWGIWE